VQACGREQLELALAITAAALGPHHGDVGIWRNNLGLVLRDLGDLARGPASSSSGRWRSPLRCWGRDHPDLAIIRSNLWPADDET
jgi:hypothetical protein